jgi:hypothetical protein
VKRALTLIVVALCLAGCADDDKPERDSPERTLKAYLAALAEGDGDRACDELTERGRDELAALVPLHLRVAAMKDCVATAEQVSEAMYPALADDLIDAELGEVRVAGGTAIASPRGGPARIRLVRRGGDWLIDQQLRAGWREMGVPPVPRGVPEGAECDPSASGVDCG